MTSRVLETVLTGRNLLSPVLAAAGRDVVAFNSTVAGANEKASAGSAASARAQQAAATSSAAASGKAAAASAAGAATQSGAADKIAASNVKASTSASASTQQQMRAHSQAAQSATLNARIQETANRSLAASNGLLGASLTPLTAKAGGAALALGYAGYRGMEFGGAMAEVRAASQATGSDLNRLRETAKELGADTQFSSEEAAQGITEMAKAGVATTDIINGGLKGALNLAAAGQMEVADAAELGATAMNVFNLKGDQMSHVADLLAAGAGKAQGSVHDMGAALNQSALVANAAGLSIEETAGSLALFASQGLTGSDAGTSFRQMLLHLQAPSGTAQKQMDALNISMYNARGEFIGMEALAGQLQTRMAGLTQAERDKAMAVIFGADAVRASNILYEAGSVGIKEWTTNVNDAGFAARYAAQLNDYLGGDLEKMGGAFDATMTSIGDGVQGPLRLLTQMLTGLISGVGWVADAFGSLPGPVQTGIVALGAFVALRGPVSGAFEKMADSILGWSLANDRATASTGGLRAAGAGLLGFFGGPWGLAITGAAMGLSLLVSWLGKSDDATDAAADAQRGLTSALEASRGAINDSVRAAAVKAAQDAGILDAMEAAGLSTAKVTEAILGQGNAYNEVMAGLVGYRDAHTGMTGEQTAEAHATRLAIDALQALSGETEGTVADAQQRARATGEAGAAMAASTVQTEEAIKALQDWMEAAMKINAGFADPLATYKGLLDEKTAAEREAAEKTAAATEDATDSWKDHVGEVDVSLDELADRFEQQLIDQANWRTNLAQVAQWAGADVAQALFNMGEEGIGLTAKMADGTSAEAQRMAGLITEDIRRGGEEWSGAMRDEWKVLDAITRAGAGATVKGIGDELGLGLNEVARIAAQYGIALSTGINPILRGLGKPVINYNQQNDGRRYAGSQEFSDGGYTGPGGKYTPAGIVHAGEFVLTKEQTARLGIDRIEEFANRGYANGGFVTAADVPRPRSTAPYGPPISTAADATMQKGFDEVRAWLTANAGVAGSGAVTGQWMSLWNLVKTQIPQARINSTFRPGDPGYHGRNKAVDFGYGTGPGGAGSAGLASINRLLHDQVGRNLAELIYDGMGDDRPDLKNGKPLTYSAATRAQHANHVHAAVADTGGVMESGTAHLNLSGRPERTLSPQQTETFDRWLTSPAAMPGYGMGGGWGGSGATRPIVVSLAGATVTGRFELGTDGFATLVDGRIDGKLDEIHDVIHYAGG